MIAILISFVSGFLSLALLQILLLYFILRRQLHRYATPLPSAFSHHPTIRNTQHKFPPSHLSLEGDIWVATLSSSDAGKRVETSEKASKESRKRRDGTKDLWEVHPIRVFARLEGHILFLKAIEGDEEAIHLDGCDVRAVSGGSEFSRKWAKRYPIRLQIETGYLYAGSSTLLIYLETSRKKEIWCQVLRAASGLGNYTEDKYIGIKDEFDSYCQQLNEVYPTLWLIQPDSNKTGYQLDGKKETSKLEVAGVSKKRQLWRKFTRKNSSRGSSREGKSRGGSGEKSHSVHVMQSQAQDDQGLQENVDDVSHDKSTMNLDRKLSHKISTPDTISENGELGESIKNNFRASSTADMHANGSEESLDETSVMRTSRSHVDQGTLCWNMLFSRLFFDFYHSSKFRAACKKLIEKQISKVTIPSYIGNISCTNLDFGPLPPFLYKMHTLPMSGDGEWAVEAVLDYSGGALLTVETRLDVCDSISQEKVVNQSFEPTLAGAAAADLLKNVEEDLETDKVVTSQANVISGSNRGSSKGLGSSCD